MTAQYQGRRPTFCCTWLAFESAGNKEAAIAGYWRREVVLSEPDVRTHPDADSKKIVGWTNTGPSGAGLSDMVFACNYKARKKVTDVHRKGADELARARDGLNVTLVGRSVA